MPGIFTPPRPTGDFDSRSHIFAPAPRASVAASETTGLQVTEPDDHTTQKRSRYDDLDIEGTYSPNVVKPWPSSLGSSRTADVRSPPPLANDRYELAGGMEGMDRFAGHNGNYDDYFNLEQHRGMWLAPTSPPSSLPQQQHLYGASDRPKPWVLNHLMNLVGGVAGKLFQFCSVPFRGFQAGGGHAYTFENAEVAAKLGLGEGSWDENTGVTQQNVSRNLAENDYGVLSIESLDSERPRTKRLRTGDSWVVVDPDGSMVSRPSTPRLAARRIPSHGKSPSQIPRPASRASAATPAARRPSLIPVSRRSTMDKRLFQSSPQTMPPSHGSPRSYSRQGHGSPSMLEGKMGQKNSPLPAESQRLINKMRREEMEDDARMRRMSCQMSAMLREAREALGTKFEVEVEDEDMDDGADDNVHAQRMRLFPR